MNLRERLGEVMQQAARGLARAGARLAAGKLAEHVEREEDLEEPPPRAPTLSPAAMRMRQEVHEPQERSAPMQELPLKGSYAERVARARQRG